MSCQDTNESSSSGDGSGPTSPSISINRSTSVTLNLSASDTVGVTAYYASETNTTPTTGASGWTSVTSATSYSANVSYTLSSGGGSKTVYVWFKNASGNISASASDTINYQLLSDSGDSTCYDDNAALASCPNEGASYYGQDGNYTINAPSFTDNSNETVTDNNTGLMWQQCPANYSGNGCTTDDGTNLFTYADAVSYCDDLVLPAGGNSDWRLPTVSEVYRISNYGTNSPSVDTTFFPNRNVISQYWSITENPADTGFAYINYQGGDGYSGSNIKTVTAAVSCVRGGTTLTPTLTDNNDNTITDSATGLMWQKTEGGQKLSWEIALSYCADLSIGNQSDWRLPNIKELESIADYTKTDPGIDTTYFPDVPGSTGDSKAYWSSTNYNGQGGSDNLAFDFEDKHSENYSKDSGDFDDDGYARCVRGGL